MHAQWDILLDDDFLHAYEHGIVITCSDGVCRRFYPRIFTYSADYPEKSVFPTYLSLVVDLFSRILLASIRQLGICPCPRCLIPLSEVHKLGTKRDIARRVTRARVDDQSRRGKVVAARRLIYQKNYPINSLAVENLLKEQSLVPTDVRDPIIMSYLLSKHPTFVSPECVLEETLAFWFQFLFAVCG
jgi:hypothetical protein